MQVLSIQPQIGPRVKYTPSFGHSAVKTGEKVALAGLGALSAAGIAAVNMKKGKLSHLSDEQKAEIRELRYYGKKFNLDINDDIEKTIASKTNDLRELEIKYFLGIEKLRASVASQKSDETRNFWKNNKKMINDFRQEIINIINSPDRKIKDKNIVHYLSLVTYANKDFAHYVFSDDERSANYRSYVYGLYSMSNNDRDFPMAKMLLEEGIKPNHLSYYFENFRYVPLLGKSPEEIRGYLKQINEQEKLVRKNPDLYINDYCCYKDPIGTFFSDPGRKIQMMIFLDTFNNDKGLLNDLLRMRLYDASEYLGKLVELFAQFPTVRSDNPDGIEYDDNGNVILKEGMEVVYKNPDKYLKKLLNSKKPDGSELTSKEKFDLIKNMDKLAYLYESDEDFDNTVQNGVINETEIKDRLIESILMLTDCDKSKKVSENAKKMLNTLDNEKLQLLSKSLIEHTENYEFNQKEVEEDDLDSIMFALLISYTLRNDFKKLLNNKKTMIGDANYKTEQFYSAYNLDYEKWLNIKDTARFEHLDENINRLKQISDELIKDIEAMRTSPAGEIFDKKMKDYVSDGNFVIPGEILNNPNLLKDFIQKMINITEPMKRQALRNNNRNALTIFAHFEQRLKDLDSVKHIRTAQKSDFTIKMWDRDPLHDLFQGNYSDCCIAIGECNESAITHYLLHTAFNMIEIVDNTTGETIGNALCYFAENKCKPVFVIDNIEIKPNKKPSKEGQIELRNTIADYAKQVARKVSGNNEIEIYMGNQANDVTTDDLTLKKKSIVFIGATSPVEVYLDTFGGWKYPDKLIGLRSLYKL